MAETELTGLEIGDYTLTLADFTGSLVDGDPSTPSLRSLGTGSNQAAPGDDPRFSTIGGADPHAEFVVAMQTASLPAARALSAGVGVDIVDAGPGSTITVGASIVGQGGIEVLTGSYGEVIVSGAAGGSSVDEKVKVSATDASPGTLVEKLVPGQDVAFATLNSGGVEQLRIDARNVDRMNFNSSYYEPFIWVAYSSWALLSKFDFRGSDVRMPTAIRAVVDGAYLNDQFELRVYDATNYAIVAQTTVTVAVDAQVVDFGTLSNVSSTPAVWELHGRVVTSYGVVYSLMIDY